MPISLEELAGHVQGTIVGGAAALSITGAATLETAGPTDVTLIDAADKLHLLAKSRACAAIVPQGSGALERPTVEVAHVPVNIGQRLERRVGMVADRENGGAAATTADRLGDGHGKPAPAGDDADRLARERAWIVRHGRMHDGVHGEMRNEGAVQPAPGGSGRLGAAAALCLRL